MYQRSSTLEVVVTGASAVARPTPAVAFAKRGAHRTARPGTRRAGDHTAVMRSDYISRLQEEHAQIYYVLRGLIEELRE